MSRFCCNLCAKELFLNEYAKTPQNCCRKFIKREKDELKIFKSAMNDFSSSIQNKNQHCTGIMLPR